MFQKNMENNSHACEVHGCFALKNVILSYESFYSVYINPIHQITASAVNVTRVSIVIP